MGLGCDVDKVQMLRRDSWGKIMSDIYEVYEIHGNVFSYSALAYTNGLHGMK